MRLVVASTIWVLLVGLRVDNHRLVSFHMCGTDVGPSVQIAWDLGEGGGLLHKGFVVTFSTVPKVYCNSFKH